MCIAGNSPATGGQELHPRPPQPAILSRRELDRNQCRRQKRGKTRSALTIFKESLACVHDCIPGFVKMQFLDLSEYRWEHILQEPLNVSEPHRAHTTVPFHRTGKELPYEHSHTSTETAVLNKLHEFSELPQNGETFFAFLESPNDESFS